MIRTLAMIKMEKNFVAVIEKGYPRRPYEKYPVIDKRNPYKCHRGFVKREMAELELELKILQAQMETKKKGMMNVDSLISETILKAMYEVGDVSNALDYLFEALTKMHAEASQ